MKQIESEILMRVSHLDGEKKSAVLDYIRNLDGGRHSTKKTPTFGNAPN